jgi:alkylation response protein AidB-like acyl-CoA dehydrogenase
LSFARRGDTKARAEARVIDFGLDDELELLRSTARAFAEAELRPREREHEAARAIAPEAARRCREIGLADVELPERLGGGGLGALARALVLEELAAADAGAALALDPLGPALYPLLELAGDAGLDALAAPLLEQAGARAVLAYVPALELPAAGGTLSLALPWVPADRVDLLILLARDGACAVRDGIALERLRGAGLRAAGASALRLERAPVAAAWRDARAAARALARARLYVASLLVGTMRASAEYSRAYALERVAFGRPIAHHQALAFLIADMAAAVEGSRWLVWEAAARVDAGGAADEAAATAFTEAAEQSLFVTPNGLQILGGHGFMQDYPVEKWMREARTLGLLLGGVDAAREDAGRDLVLQARDTALPMWSD